MGGWEEEGGGHNLLKKCIKIENAFQEYWKFPFSDIAKLSPSVSSAGLS